MIPQRAQWLLDNRVGDYCPELRYAFRGVYDQPDKVVYPNGITTEEDNYVKGCWNFMGGSTCYHDALRRIAAGKFMAWSCECDKAPMPAEEWSYEYLAAHGPPECDDCESEMTLIPY